jgi:hypothetical protein
VDPCPALTTKNNNCLDSSNYIEAAQALIGLPQRPQNLVVAA